MTVKRRSYLEVVLTINAIALTGLLWTTVTGTSVLSPSVANAGQQSPPKSFANSLDQRDRMIRSLDQMSRDIQGLRSDIQEMEFKVQVVSMPTIIGAAEGRSSDSSSKQIRASNPQVVRITNNSNKDSRSQDDN